MTEPELPAQFNGHEVYPMPMFLTLTLPDLEAAIGWYEAALGFSAMFVSRGPDGRVQMAHLRRARYQDLLLVPGEAVGEPPSATLSLRADGVPAELARRAQEAAPVGCSAVDGPYDTPWNTTDVRVTDPAGHRLVLTAARVTRDPELEAQMRAWLERGRTS
jgi:uncharacterized glyoxalase superfamily protein PhnB